MSEVVQFEQSPELLKQVFCDQAGDVYKGIMEAVQNLTDGIFEAEEEGLLTRDLAEIGVNIEGSKLIIWGNGIGLTKDDANTVFKVFGISYKRGNSNRLGEKGMGRGQTISMVYDSAQDKMIGSCEIISGSRREGGTLRIHDIDVPSLSYRITPGGRTKGTQWILTKFEGEWDEIAIRKYVVKNLARLPIRLRVNGEIVNKKITNDNFEKVFRYEEATIGVNRWGGEFELFERGLLVNEYEILDGFSGVILSRKPMKLNFARNDVKHDDPVWRKVSKMLLEDLTNMVLSMRDASIDGRKASGLMDLLASDSLTESGTRNVMEKKMFTTALGDRVSLQDIQASGEVVWGSNRSRKADVVSRMGHIVMEHSYEAEKVMDSIGVEAKYIEDVKVRGTTSTTYETEKLPKYKQSLIEFLGNFTPRRIQLGKSPGFLAWTNGESYITWSDQDVDWNIVKDAIKTGNWDSVFWNMVETLSHEEAHSDNDEFTDVHGVEFYQNQVRILERMTKRYFETRIAEVK